jgi:hypothetical protein
MASYQDLRHDTISFDPNYFRGPTRFRKDQPVTVRNVSKQPSSFERIASLRTGQDLARFLKGIHGACILAADVSRDFLLHDVGPYVGGTSPLSSQPRTLEFIGSLEIIIV